MRGTDAGRRLPKRPPLRLPRGRPPRPRRDPGAMPSLAPTTSRAPTHPQGEGRHASDAPAPPRPQTRHNLPKPAQTCHPPTRRRKTNPSLISPSPHPLISLSSPRPLRLCGEPFPPRATKRHTAPHFATKSPAGAKRTHLPFVPFVLFVVQSSAHLTPDTPSHAHALS
jgi:hypothetical protein